MSNLLAQRRPDNTHWLPRMTPFRRDLRAYIVTSAQQDRFMTYEELAAFAYPNTRTPANYLAQHLDAISWHEFTHGRPLLSAIVVWKYTTNVGPGFWIMVEKEMLIPVANREQFLDNAQQSVFSFWRVA